MGLSLFFLGPRQSPVPNYGHEQSYEPGVDIQHTSAGCTSSLTAFIPSKTGSTTRERVTKKLFSVEIFGPRAARHEPVIELNNFCAGQYMKYILKMTWKFGKFC